MKKFILKMSTATLAVSLITMFFPSSTPNGLFKRLASCC